MVAPVVKILSGNLDAVSPLLKDGSPLIFLLSITLLGTNYLSMERMYFFWSQKEITGALKVPWTSGPVSDALQFPGTSFGHGHGFWMLGPLQLSEFSTFWCSKYLSFSDTASSPGQCLSLWGSAVCMLRLTRLLPVQALSHDGNFVLALTWFIQSLACDAYIRKASWDFPGGFSG